LKLEVWGFSGAWCLGFGILVSFPSSHECHHHSLNLQFFLRDEIGVAGIFRAQVGFALLQDEGLEGDLAVNERGHDVAGARLDAVLDNGDVAIDDAFAEHGIAADFEAEGPGGGFNAEGIDINQDAAFLLLGGVFGPAGGDGAVDGNGDDAWPGAVGGIGTDHLKGAGAAGKLLQKALGAEGLDVAKGGVGAAEAEMRGDFAQGGGQPFGVLFVLDEIQDLSLSGGKVFHSDPFRMFGAAFPVPSFNYYWTLVQ